LEAAIVKMNSRSRFSKSFASEIGEKRSHVIKARGALLSTEKGAFTNENLEFFACMLL
jgi:hypothetical protein